MKSLLIKVALIIYSVFLLFMSCYVGLTLFGEPVNFKDISIELLVIVYNIFFIYFSFAVTTIVLGAMTYRTFKQNKQKQ